MLIGEIPAGIPFVSKALDSLDALKVKFLAVPANARAALEKLARIRTEVNKGGNVPADWNTSAMAVENNLKKVQTEWGKSASTFSTLDSMRAAGGSILTTDGLLLAAQLTKSATFVINNADASARAVDNLAARYLTPEQRTQLNISTVGTNGIGGSALFLAAGLVGVAFLMRKRAR